MKITMREADVVVIGAGPGGYVAAIRAAQIGKRVVLIEKDSLGGECLNYGCIPSKALIEVSKIFYRIEKVKNIGITVTDLQLDLKKTQQWKMNVVKRLNSGIKLLCEYNGVEIIYGKAEIVSEKEILVEQEDSKINIKVNNIIIATGSKPKKLEKLEVDGKLILNSKEILELQEPPDSLLIVGAGAIGLEIGTLYSKLGTQVTIIEITNSILPGIDQEITKIVYRSMEKLGMKILLQSTINEVNKSEEKIEVKFTQNKKEHKIEISKILVAVGREPNIEGFGIEKLALELDKYSHIKVNSFMKTNIENIYAIGDVTGPPWLAHKASVQGIIAAEATDNNLRNKYDGRNVPYAIFTDPEVAVIGMSEKEVLNKGIDVKIGRFPFSANGRALTSDQYEGLVKVIVEKESERIIGIHIVGNEASELISEGSLAIESNMKDITLENTIHPHPTLSEAIKEAIKDALGRSIHTINRNETL